jgi:hypothetical protein
LISITIRSFDFPEGIRFFPFCPSCPLRFLADQQKGKSSFPLRSLRLCGELLPKTNIETDLFGSFGNWKLEFAAPGLVEILFKFPGYPAVLSHKVPETLV